jgi:hypothetical protein
MICNDSNIIVVTRIVPFGFFLTDEVRPEPAKRRIALGRRLKGMGAVYLQNGVCLLPKTDDHVRRLKMVEDEIAEMGGESVIRETVDPRKRRWSLASRLIVTSSIGDFSPRPSISRLRSPKRPPLAISHTPNDIDLEKLQGWLEKIRKLDF